jgi:hypothetical protein
MRSTAVDFDTITEGLPTKSEKIRALAREGASTADIARYLGIRYQHARNVLIESGLHTRRGDASNGGEQDRQASKSEHVAWIRTDALARLQVPSELLRIAGIAGDEPVYARATKDGVELLSRRAALKRAHDIARKFVPDGVSLADELIAERRREAEMDNG